MKAASAELFVRIAFMPARVARTATTGLQMLLKTKAFMARLIVQMQTLGMMVMIVSLSQLLPRPGAPEPHGPSACVALGFSHTWDETKQMLRDIVPEVADNPYSKRPAQKVGRTILV